MLVCSKIVYYLFFFFQPYSYIYFFTGLEEQYIILIFQTGLDPQANVVFESIITDIGIKNNVSNFFAKIPFEEANSRLVACTRSYEESIKGNCVQKENKVKTVIIFKNLIVVLIMCNSVCFL